MAEVKGQTGRISLGSKKRSVVDTRRRRWVAYICFLWREDGFNQLETIHASERPRRAREHT